MKEELKELKLKIRDLRSFSKKEHAKASKKALKLANEVPAGGNYWKEIGKMEAYSEIYNELRDDHPLSLSCNNSGDAR